MTAVAAVDARGLDCPQPVLETRRALRDLGPGEAVEVLATDPGALADFHAFCRMAGHELVLAQDEGEHFRFIVRKAAA